MLHGDATIADRRLAEIHPAIQAAIARVFASNPAAALLEVGCGRGTLLRELKENHPGGSFYGLDPQRPADTRGFEFFEQSVEVPVVGQYDIIISYAVMPYVIDVKAAFRNIARALKPGGIAKIHLEPFYLGPYGIKMFQEPSIAFWNTALDIVTVLPGDGAGILQGYICYDLPMEVQLRNYYDTHLFGGIRQIPAYYTEKEVIEFRAGGVPIGDPVLSETGYPVEVINWKTVSFLQVKTRNPLGTEGPGDREHRPYQHAAKRIYLTVPDLPISVVVGIFLNPKNYDPKMRKAEYVFSPEENYLRSEIRSKFAITFAEHRLIRREEWAIRYNTFDGGQALRRAVVFEDEEGVAEICKLDCPFDYSLIDAQDTNPAKCYTALHLALRNGKFEVASVLLAEGGARVDIKDASGITAASLIRDLSSEERAVVLRGTTSDTSIFSRGCSFFGRVVVVSTGLAVAVAAAAYYVKSSR